MLLQFEYYMSSEIVKLTTCDNQVRNAIQIAWNPTADPNFKGQAFEFINQLRSEPTGWQPCVQLFLQAPKLTEVVRLTSLEILCNALQNGYLDPQSISYVKNVLLDYTKSIYGNTSNIEGTDDAGIQNKLAQSFTYLFTSTYKDSWLDYFDNLLDLTNGPGPCDHLPGVIFYLRALSSVSDEIADVVVSRSPESIKRNNELKDLIRTRHATKVASSWQHILERWRVESTITINMCLKVISQWVSWIDISLVVNDQMIGLLLHFIGQSSIENTSATNEDTRNPAMSTLTEIVSKKMAMPAKIELITYLNLGDIIKQLVESPQLSRLRSTSSYDTDLAESIARLTNVAFLDIVKTLNTEKLETQSRQQADVLMHKFLPSILRFFSDEYDEICSTVIPSLTELLAFFRKASTNTNRLEAQYYNLLEPILNAIILKMRYDETSSWGAEDDQTDEAEFQELRKRLQVLQRSIAAIADSLYIDTLSGVARNAFDSFSQQDGRIDWRDLNLALHEMYLLGELTAKTGSLYLKSQPASRAAEALIPLMSQMVNSGMLACLELLLYDLMPYQELPNLPIQLYSCNSWKSAFDTALFSK
jgi:exportin-T